MPGIARFWKLLLLCPQPSLWLCTWHRDSSVLLLEVMCVQLVNCQPSARAPVLCCAVCVFCHLFLLLDKAVTFKRLPSVECCKKRSPLCVLWLLESCFHVVKSLVLQYWGNLECGFANPSLSGSQLELCTDILFHHCGKIETFRAASDPIGSADSNRNVSS